MSIQIYPVIPVEPQCSDYTVFVNGKQVATNTARVSAVPFNRRWPGHQRDISQSEAIQFLSLAADQPIDFEIIPNLPFDIDKLKIRPRSLGIKPTLRDGKICFTLPHPAYFTVEAYGRNKALHLFVDPIKDYGVDPRDPNVIYFGEGEHDVGTIHIQSGQTLYLEEGAVVYACVRAVDAKDIRILGRGILDNSRNKEQIYYQANVENNSAAVTNAKRLHTVQIEYCDNVTIDGITVRDSLVYNIRPIACTDLTIRNIKIIGCWRYNSDGIDMHNCLNVHISDCFLRTYDDSICVKGFDFYHAGDFQKALLDATYRNGRVYNVFKNVLIENCVVWNDWGNALEIGAETRAEEIADIRFLNCDVIHVTGNVCDCYNVDYADVHHITWENINIEADEIIPKPLIQKNDSETYVNTDPNFVPNAIAARVEHHHEYSAGSERRGKNRELLFKNIRYFSDRPLRAQFFGYDANHKTENVLISGIYHNESPIERIDGSGWDIREFTENIRLEVPDYRELEKNTVDSMGQLSGDALLRSADAKDGVKVMFVGNSITLHSVRPQIGWHGNWGMAASSEEKDYVHIVQSEIRKRHPDASFCICQVADWERCYKNGGELLEKYAFARDFGADLIILRFVENCPGDNFDHETFYAELTRLMDYLNPTGKAKFIVTTGFWRHPGDRELIRYAEDHGYPCVELGDLGTDDRMKAI